MSGFHSKGDEKFILRKIENSLGIWSRSLKQGGFWLKNKEEKLKHRLVGRSGG